MNIKKQIESTITKEVEYALTELDIDGMVEKMISKEAVKTEVEKLIKEKIVETFQNKVLLKYRNANLLIDAWADNQLRDLFIKLGINS
jgi:hypothetical protein